MRPVFTFPKISASLYESQPWSRPGVEPPLCDVLADPLIQVIMQSDGVSPASLEDVIAQAQQRLKNRHKVGIPIVPRYRC